MDEMWQRHKSFILQIIVGGVVFLVAFFVMRSRYGDDNDPEKVQARNLTRLKEFQAKIAQGRAPSTDSITKQKEGAAKAEAQRGALAKRVASVVGRDEKTKEADRENAYVGESIGLALANIGKTDSGVLMDTYKKTGPQAALSGLVADARNVLAGRAGQSGKEIDESLGLAGGFQTDEIPQVLHALAVETDLMSRCLAMRGIEKVNAVRISPNNTFPENNDVAFLSSAGQHMEIYGDPLEINEVLRSCNAVDKKDQRMIVIERIESIAQVNPDEDTVKASIDVVGLRLKSDKPAEGK